MSDHDDALYDSQGWLRTNFPLVRLAVYSLSDEVVVEIDLDNPGADSRIAGLTRPQVDELIRMLILARSETWPPQGYDDGDEEAEQEDQS